MTLISEVARRAHRRWWLTCGTGLVAVVGVATWAWWPLSYAVTAVRVAEIPTERQPLAPIATPTWNVRLWQPFTDTPVVSEQAPPPLTLYSILKRDGVFIAALAADNAPMVYARTGDVVEGVTIRSIDANGVEVRSPTGDQRLELRP
jgi:hypothetical protein